MCVNKGILDFDFVVRKRIVSVETSDVPPHSLKVIIKFETGIPDLIIEYPIVSFDCQNEDAIKEQIEKEVIKHVHEYSVDNVSGDRDVKLVQQFKTMLETQAALNDLMGGKEWRNVDNWLDYKFNYARAIKVEIAEAISHLPYKWWVKKEADVTQFKMELIDICHFLLSESMVLCAAVYRKDSKIDSDLMDRIADEAVESWHIAKELVGEITEPDFEHSIQSLEYLDLSLYSANYEEEAVVSEPWTHLFAAMMFADPKATFDDISRQYLAKSALNVFRTKNGAREHGVAYTPNEFRANPNMYLKVWAEEEDTVHLSRFVGRLSEDGNLNLNSLEEALTAAYTSVKENVLQ